MFEIKQSSVAFIFIGYYIKLESKKAVVDSNVRFEFNRCLNKIIVDHHRNIANINSSVDSVVAVGDQVVKPHLDLIQHIHIHHIGSTASTLQPGVKHISQPSSSLHHCVFILPMSMVQPRMTFVESSI